ncbi:MAG TPA: hypothetical protein VMF88_04265 [Bacteroidota bacterium]|nr:hypothetical protein [Bacteroidota bacterium]
MDSRKITSVLFFVIAASLLQWGSLSGKPIVSSPSQFRSALYQCSKPAEGRFNGKALNSVEVQRELTFRTHRGLQEDNDKIFAYLIISLGVYSPARCSVVSTVTTLFISQYHSSLPSLRAPPSLS